MDTLKIDAPAKVGELGTSEEGETLEQYMKRADAFCDEIKNQILDKIGTDQASVAALRICALIFEELNHPGFNTIKDLYGADLLYTALVKIRR